VKTLLSVQDREKLRHTGVGADEGEALGTIDVTGCADGLAVGIDVTGESVGATEGALLGDAEGDCVGTMLPEHWIEHCTNCVSAPTTTHMGKASNPCSKVSDISTSEWLSLSKTHRSPRGVFWVWKTSSEDNSFHSSFHPLPMAYIPSNLS